MTRCLICLSTVILFGVKLCAQSNDTIPPTFSFDLEELKNNYGEENVKSFIDTTIISLSCRDTFPEEYNAFPDPIFENEELYPDTSYVDVTNHENISVTRIWTAIDASANRSIHY